MNSRPESKRPFGLSGNLIIRSDGLVAGAFGTSNIKIPTCGWCNGIHSGRCPKVKAIEYHPNGTVKRVEFK